MSEPVTRQPQDHSVCRLAAALDVMGALLERNPQPALYGADAQSKLLGDLPVGLASEVGEPHDPVLIAWQRVQCLVDRQSHHRPGEVSPALRLGPAIGNPFDQHLLEATMRSPKPARIRRACVAARNEPAAPRFGSLELAGDGPGAAEWPQRFRSGRARAHWA